jgi:hypothetical protein
MNRAYIKRLENLIRLDCTLSDLDSERATGNLERDKLPTGACFFGSMNR